MTRPAQAGRARLTEAEVAALANALARSTRSPEHLAFLVTPAVESIVAARVGDALAEVERRIEAWIRHGEAVPPDVTEYDREIVHVDLRCLVHTLRAELGGDHD